MIAEPLGLFDCCGVSDGAAAAIVTTPEIARRLGKENIVNIKALQLSLSNGSEAGHSSWDGSYFHTTRIAATKAYAEAGIRNPREEVSMFECHDCFSITEFVTTEDLQLSPEGGALKDVMDGFYDADGAIPARSTAASSASATRSARPESACSTRCTCNCRGARKSVSFPTRALG